MVGTGHQYLLILSYIYGLQCNPHIYIYVIRYIRRPTYIQTGRQAGRQTDIHTHTYTYTIYIYTLSKSSHYYSVVAINIVVITIRITIVIIMHDIIHMLYSPSCTAGDVP